MDNQGFQSKKKVGREGEEAEGCLALVETVGVERKPCQASPHPEHNNSKRPEGSDPF